MLEPLLDQTVRMIIAPHQAGDTVRVHLTNRFGSSPVALGPVTIGVRSSGAALAPGSERAVTFGGQSAVTISPGADAVSDPVTLTFAAFQDLAVSVAVPGIVLAPTEHVATRQTSYQSPILSGDHAAESGGSSFTQTTTGSFSTGWYFLDGVDVLAPGTVGAVVTFGDSITDGYQGIASSTEQLATIDTDGRYPDDLARRLRDAGVPLSVLNAGLGSNFLLSSSTANGPSGLLRFTTDALSQPGITDVIVLEGINDIRSGATAGQLTGAYQQLIAQAHAAGVSVQLGTITPDGVADPVRDAVNQWIRTQRLSDGVIDFDAAVRDPGNPSAISPSYDGGDHIHLSLAGYQAMADAVDLAALARPQCMLVAPVARVSVSPASPARARQRFTLRWSGSDAGGPGVASFTVQVERIRARPGHRPHADRWKTLRGLAATTETSVRFAGHRRDTYRFRVCATDKAGVSGRWATTSRV